MNAKQKKFIEKKLIPFILREHGNGFAMSTWRDKYTQKILKMLGEEKTYD